jgi:nucleoside-diphosphate-sugar epimerase
VNRILVTGGSGFIGSGLVKTLVRVGHHVRVLDDNSRGSPRRLKEVEKDIEFIAGDVRDADAVAKAAQDMDEVHHLAFVNGTEFFYKMPELVLDVGVRGMINVIDACRKHNVGTLILASSSEVYQTPPQIPTAEDAPLVVPDLLNPRYSYGAGKLISEVLAINFGRKFFDRLLVFRPHNVYGPDMGFEHVIPQFALRIQKLAQEQPSGVLRFAIQGSGAETRSFCFIDDLVAGVMTMREKGEQLGIYHVGTMEEVAIADLAQRIASAASRAIELVPGPPAKGGAPRRCPDISKLARLGYKPRVQLDDGLKTTLEWYWRNAELAPKARAH